MNSALLKTGAAWLATSLAALTVVIVTLTDPGVLRPPLWPPALLLIGATLCALIALPTSERGPRAGGVFAVTALLTLPPPLGVAIALVAGAISAPALAGRGPRGPAALAALALAAWAVSGAMPLLPAPDDHASLFGLALALGVSALFHVVALLAGSLLHAEPSRQPWRGGLAGDILLGAVSWRLWLTISAGDRVAALSLTVVLIAASWILTQRSLLRADLDRTRRSLSSRVIELETLHSVSLEMLASLEPERICAVVDRECRKIFPVDFTFVALAEREGAELSLVYHRSDGAPATDTRPLEPGLASAVARERRSLRVSSFAELPAEMQRDWVGPGAGSALVVPLIVEDRVIGVISVQSRVADAYDDHQLALLTTMAQQAAVAIENARHYQMANVDSLTGFFHRDYFFRRVEEEYRRVQRYGGQFALLMIDLDSFKTVNDDHGHLVGDRYLESIARTISAQLRGADLACRYGGDEFCLLLPETSFSGGTVIAERIREAISTKVVDADGVSVRSTSSIGLAAFPEHDAGHVNGLLRNADEALYRAKRDGRNCVKPFAA